MESSVENGNQTKPGFKKKDFGLKKNTGYHKKKYLFSLHKQIQKEDNYVRCLTVESLHVIWKLDFGLTLKL